MRTRAATRMPGKRLWSGIMAGLLFLMVASVSWAAPTVTGIQPPDGGLAPIDTTVTASFNEAMDPATITTGSFTLSQFVGFKAIAAGGIHTLALKNDGTVIAWGDNRYGETLVPAGLSDVTAIAAGGIHTLALKNDGTVIAWGYNNYGQTLVPAGLSDVTSIAAGSYFTVALKNDGTVVAWGFNDYGETTVPADLSGVTAIAAGSNHTVALKTDGTVVAWGGVNSYGETTVPAGLSGVTAIAAGWAHTVALKNDGTVVAWGFNDYGQTTVPADLSGVTAIATGDMHTVALKTDGTVVAWGWNGYGQTTVPAGLFGVIEIAAGSNHTVALKNDGTVVAWGNNTSNQTKPPVGISGVMAIAAGGWNYMGLKTDGTVVAWGSNAFGQTSVPAGLSSVTAIAAGAIYHTVALKSDGTVVAWGLNDYGETTVPADLSDVTAIAAGCYHTVALKSDGTVVAWGKNDYGQTTIPSNLSDIMTIAAGCSHSVALKNDGTVVTWGWNGYGQTTVPADLSGVTAIAAGYDHTVALKNNGTVVAWGRNAFGQTTVPTDLSGVTAIAAGNYHTVALKNDSTVVAWGGIDNGQTTVPAGLSDVTAIAAGYDHAVALKNDGTVVGWGYYIWQDGPATWGYDYYSTFFSPIGSEETAVAGTVAYNTGTRTATFTPSTPLYLGETYFATVNTGVRSLLGDPLPADVRWSFTTGAPLSVTVTGSGAVHSAPAPDINCTGGQCVQVYAPGTLVTLTAAAGAGSALSGWQGCDSIAGAVCSVTMNAARSVTASFGPYAITTPSPLPNATVGTPYSATLAASGGIPPYAWSIAAGTLPAGLGLNSATGTISGTPTASGNAGFTVRVTDSIGAATSKAFTLNVVLDTLVITTASPLPTGTVGVAYATTITATGGFKPYTWSWSKNSGSSLPTGLSINAATGAISGTPTKVGTYSFTVKVTDSRSPVVSASKSFTLQVVAAPKPLTITTSSPLARATVGRSYSTTLVATGGMTPYAWAITVGALPPGLNLNASTGTISGTPTKAGTYTFTSRVTDSRGTQASKAFALTCR